MEQRGRVQDVDPANRREFISQMKDFIERECAEIGEILTEMSWTPDYILQKNTVVQCPYDQSHEMPETSLKQHAAVCCLKKMGLLEEEVETELREDDFFYKNANIVGKVQLDEALLNRILWNHCMENRQVNMGHRSMPVSADDWTMKLSPKDRLAVYEYCVKTLKEEGKMPNVEKDEDLTTDWERIIKKGLLDMVGDKPKSRVELMAMLRDQKRRRQSYRAKNVHITKKSYTEIIRELILNQMEIMMPSEEDKQQQKQEDTESAQDKDVGREDWSRSSDHSRSSSRRKRNRSRSPHRKRSHYSRGSRSPRRSRSRSRSPQAKDRKTSRQKRDGSYSPGRADDADNERRHSSVQLSSRPEYEEGQIESDDSTFTHQHRSHSKKKSSKSKHKKHKHKKHKSRSYPSDSD